MSQEEKNEKKEKDEDVRTSKEHVEFSHDEDPDIGGEQVLY